MELRWLVNILQYRTYILYNGDVCMLDEHGKYIAGYWSEWKAVPRFDLPPSTTPGGI